MAKSKNHTNHNQSRKEHRNPTRKPSAKTRIRMKGVSILSTTGDTINFSGRLVKPTLSMFADGP